MAHSLCHWSSQSLPGFSSAVALCRMAGLEEVRHPGLRISSGGLNYVHTFLHPTPERIRRRHESRRTAFPSPCPRSQVFRAQWTSRSLSVRHVRGYVDRSECLWTVVCSAEQVLGGSSCVYG